MWRPTGPTTPTCSIMYCPIWTRSRTARLVAHGRDYDDVAPLKGFYHGAPSTGLGVTVEITRLA